MIKIDRFGGESPKIDPRLLPDGGAQIANGCDLYGGNLSPAKLNQSTSLTAPADTSSMGLLALLRDSNGDFPAVTSGQAIWKMWSEYTYCAVAPIPNEDINYLFYAEHDGRLYMDWYGNTGQDLPVGVPSPDSALTAIPSGAADEPGSIPTTRPYVYTYVIRSEGVDQYTQEGVQSPAGMCDWLPGQSVTLSGIGVPNAESGVTHKRIYRYRQGASGGAYFFVAEIGINQTTYVDYLEDSALPGGMLETDGFDAPPMKTAGIVTIAGGVMALFSGRDICFSEPHHPFAWPVDYRMVVDYDPVALAPLGNGVVVLTTGYPYVISGSHPESYGKRRLDIDQACVSHRSVVSDGSSVIYASPDGLVMISSNGASVVTKDIFTREQWQALNPQEMVVEAHNRKLVVFYRHSASGGSFIIDPDRPEASLTFSDQTAEILYRSLLEDKLYLFKPYGGQLRAYGWREANEVADYHWRSKRFTLDKPVALSCLQVNTVTNGADAISDRVVSSDYHTSNTATTARHVSVTLYGDGELIFTCRYQGSGSGHDAGSVRSGVVLRLPAVGSKSVWEVELEGDAEVSAVSVAQSMAELR